MKLNVVDCLSFAESGERFARLDAEFVDPDTLDIERNLRARHGSVMLGDLLHAPAESYARPRAVTDVKRKYVAIDDIDLQDGLVFHQELLEKDLPSRARYVLDPFDILVSNVRPERGAVGMIVESQSPAVASSGLSVVRTQGHVQRDVTYAFLRSEYARKQLARRSRGSMYPAITNDDLNGVEVPVLPPAVANAVSATVGESIEARTRFFELTKAQTSFVERLLYEMLGDPPPDIVLDVVEELSVEVIGSRTISSFGADRFDAEFHRREFVEFEGKLKMTDGVQALGKTYEAFAGGNPRRGTSLILRLRQAQLSGFGVKFHDLEEVENATAEERKVLKTGDILIGCTAHEPQYVGNRVDIFDGSASINSASILPVPDVMIIRRRPNVDGPPANFVASFLGSAWGRRQFQRLNRGVRGGHVYGNDVEKFVFLPDPPGDWLEEFGNRQSEIRVRRNESIELMDLAVGTVEATLAG